MSAVTPNRDSASGLETALTRLRVAQGGVDIFADLEATEIVGGWLAGELQTRCADLDVIVIWYEPASAVLAYLVARKLGLRVVRACEVEGLVELIDSPTGAQRAVALSDQFATANSVNALVGVARHAGLDVVGIAVAMSSQALTSAPPDITVIAAPVTTR